MRPAREVADQVYSEMWADNGTQTVETIISRIAAAIEQARVEGAQMVQAYVYYRAQQENDPIWMLRAQTDPHAILSGVVDGVDFIDAINLERDKLRGEIEKAQP